MVARESGLRRNCHGGQETHILFFASLKIKGLTQNYEQAWVKANAKFFAFYKDIKVKGAKPPPY